MNDFTVNLEIITTDEKSFSFEIKDQFFEAFTFSEVEHANISAIAKLNKDGDNISLRYTDRDSIELTEGDTVHRHLMDGDAVLFNRQPSLHRMSMMCHIVKVMKKGDTFRMNVADTKPYNADQQI